MSKFDPFTAEDHSDAASQGWCLCRVFDGPAHALQVLPLAFTPQMRNAEAARRYVASLGMNGNQLAIKAMVAISRDAMPPAMKRKKAKA